MIARLLGLSLLIKITKRDKNYNMRIQITQGAHATSGGGHGFSYFSGPDDK